MAYRAFKVGVDSYSIQKQREREKNENAHNQNKVEVDEANKSNHLMIIRVQLVQLRKQTDKDTQVVVA